MASVDKIRKKINGIFSQRSRVTFSLLSAVVLIITGYFCDNLSFFTGESLTLYSTLQFVKTKLYGEEQKESLYWGASENAQYLDSVLFINVGYDKQVINYYENDTILKGQLSITNREKLYQLLKELNQSIDYRYIILDVRFEKGYNSSIDSALFGLINDMTGKIVVAKHSGMELASPSIAKNTAFADYRSSIITTNFIRYPYIQNKEASLPVFAYKDLRHKQVLPWWHLTYCDNELCYKSLFLTFDTNTFGEFNEKTGQKNYYNLGTELLSSPEDIAELAKGKIIVVGDMVNDMHDTYVGARPGAVVLYRALVELLTDKHKVNWMRICCLFFLYSTLSYHVFRKRHKIVKQHFYRRIPLFYFLFTFVGYSTILILFDSVWFLLTNEVYGLAFQTLYFPIIKNIISFNNNE